MKHRDIVTWTRVDFSLRSIVRTGHLSKLGEAPKNLSDASDIQRRIIAYYKTFRFIHGKGKRGVQFPLPFCVLSKVRMSWPRDLSEESDELEDSIVEQIES